MRALIIVFGLALCLVSAAIAADLTGAWTFEVKLDAGSGSPTMTFKQEENRLTGQYSGALGEAPLTGTVEGTKIEFSFEVSGAKVVYKGEIAGADEMKGSVDYGGQAAGTWTAKRAKK